jgi:hypothetical protein
MKNVLFLAFLLISVGLLSQGLHNDRAHIETTCGEMALINYEKANVIDTLLCERLSYDQSYYEPYTKTIFVYDEYGRIISSEYGYYTATGFRLSSKSLFSYTLFDSLETYVGYFWNDTLNESGDWDATNFKSYTYNSENQLVNELWMYNPIGQDEWQNQRLISYTYGDGKLQKVTYSMHIVNGNWNPYMKTIYNYEADLLISRVQSYSSDDEWRNTYQYIYEYYAGQKVMITKHFSIDNWRNLFKNTCKLDNNGNILENLEEHWSSHDSIWDTLIVDKKEYGYDNYGNMISFLHKSAYIEWFNVAKEDYTFINGHYAGGIQYSWDWDTEQWFERIICNIKTLPGILSTNEPDLANQISVYPNPTTEEFSVEVPDGAEIVSIKLYDVGGKTIEQYDNASQRINISGLEKGVYFVTINLENEIVTKKLIKQQ